MENPRPDQTARELIGRQIDMTPRSVQIWFQNNRAKAKVQERKRTHLFQLPLTTTHCGGNISRIHLDMEALNRRQRSQFYCMDEFSGSAPNLSTGYASVFMNPLDTKGLSDQSSSTVYISSQPASPNFESIVSSPEPHYGSDIIDEPSCFDVVNLLRSTEYPVSHNSEELESVDGLNTGEDDIDSFLSKMIQIQAIQIGCWRRNSTFFGSILLRYIPYQTSFKIFIEEYPKADTGHGQHNGGIVIELEISNVSQPMDQLLVLNTESYPRFYQMDAWGGLEPFELDLNDGQQLDGGEVRVSGDFSSIDEDIFYVNLKESQVMDPFKLGVELASENWSIN